jgi:hypothetical protein
MLRIAISFVGLTHGSVGGGILLRTDVTLFSYGGPE